MNPKFLQGALGKGGRNANRISGTDNIPTLGAGLEELAKCDPCGCNGCLGYETLISATTGELLIRYYTGVTGGPYTEVVEPFADGLVNVQALYDAR